MSPVNAGSSDWGQLLTGGLTGDCWWCAPKLTGKLGHPNTQDDPDHQFQQPGPTDVRGNRPTLNTLAKNRYFSGDEIAEAANGTQSAYGFDYHFSISWLAATLSRANTRLIDGSITREDTYFGNNANFVLQRWGQYVDIVNRYGGPFGAETQAEDRALRYDNSRATNPESFNIAPFSINETFPENWYRWAKPFTLASTLAEVLDLFLLMPCELGANEGLNVIIPLKLDINSYTVPQLACSPVENQLRHCA
ncbi:uncharacterized protein N7459_005853 [Penicillium hispanicum]|uniref:uncharacterized protein n=1 Tax=Penicillium hispanicum TaxID=1080232 RepID=UPI002541F8FA|nr:uncharacterized protein N7459_005853 [Penicillium hispanicum]KAJ5579868.1 hypothetical protein N7459_005853 [Penicillium hispanicum]